MNTFDEEIEVSVAGVLENFVGANGTDGAQRISPVLLIEVPQVAALG